MNPIEYQAFSNFHDTVLGLVAPEGLAENLQSFFRDQLGNALSDIQTYIPWFRTFNVELVRKRTTDGFIEFCNAAVFQGPVGKVSQVFAYKPGLDCKKHYYQRASTSALDCWMERQRCLCPATTPPSSAVYDSPYCNYVLAGEDACDTPYLSGEEDDCRFKSLDQSDRIFAVGPDFKIYAAPRFPCGYALLVQWQGIRRKWNDTDLVPVDQQLRETVTNYVESRVARKEREHVSAGLYFKDYQDGLRTLSYRYVDEMETGPSRDCSAGIEQLMTDFIPLYSSYASAVTFPSSGGGILTEEPGGPGMPIIGEGGSPIIPE